MVSRTRKWGKIALGLALLPVATTIEGQLYAQSSVTSPPIAAVRDGGGNDASAARSTTAQGRAALQAGDLEAAEKFARQAKLLGKKVPFWEGDSPEKLIADIAAARASADPKVMLKQAREAIAAGKFDDAQALISRAGSANARFGMFDDNPAKCSDDLQKARAKSEKVESAKLLAEARKLIEKGMIDEAEGLALRAEKLHGPYSLLETGDRAQKVLADVQSARVKAKKNGAGMAKVSDLDRSKSAPTPDWPDDKKRVASEIVRAGATSTTNPLREPAMILMAEGKAAMLAGQFMDARDKFREAQKLDVSFKADEINPGRCLNELSIVVSGQVKAGLAAAAQTTDSPAAKEQMRQHLTRLHQLASEFGLDVQPIEQKLAAMNEIAPAVAIEAANVGKTLLDKARIEIQRGQFEIARQLATEVHNGPYQCQAEAVAILRTIAAEELAQKNAAASRGFEAGAAAYQAKDFAQAMAILRQVDSALLGDAHRLKMAEMVSNCEKMMAAPVTPVAPPPPSVVPTAMAVPQAPEAAPLIPSTPKPLTPPPATPVLEKPSSDNLANQMRALQKVEFQQLREEGQKATSQSNKLFERGETDTALDNLHAYLAKVKAANLEPADMNLLIRPVETRLQALKLVKTQKDAETKITGRKTKHDQEMGRAATAAERKQEQIKDLMKQYNQFINEGKNQEAHLAAAKAYELNPDDPALQAAKTISLQRLNHVDYTTAQGNKEKLFTKSMNDIENVNPNVGDKNPLFVDPIFAEQSKGRGRGADTILRTRTEAEREIQHKLTMPVDLHFENAPLKKVIDDVRVMTGINIVMDTAAFEDERVNHEQPVTLHVDRIPLKSALNLILSNVHLTSVIADDVLKITTNRKARGSTVQKVYRVADLVMPIEDYTQPDSQNLQMQMKRIIEQNNMNLRNGASPSNNGRNMLTDGSPVGATGTATMTTAPGSTTPATGMSPIGAATMDKKTMHEMLMRLIQNTVAPQSWAEVGGSGTVEWMPIGMALIINQTVDVQEQVQELLEALRRLQDLQVAVEIKMITLSETFFERIGLDFNLNIKTDKKTEKWEPMLTTGQFKPAGQVNDFTPSGFIGGLTPAGSLTSDLDVPIKSSSFQYGIPPFAFPNNAGFDGGLSMGLAFLSDIQVYMFMEAAQGDRRIHVMQAPKLTLFNGQSSNMSVQDQQFFVTNVGVVGFGGQIVFVPQNNPFPLGVEMTIQAVVSADRRFVRLNINQRLANLASANVPLFPVTTFITPVFEGGAQGQPIPFTQFIQQPQLSLVSIQTTVSVPDGGTVILGGLKTLSEGRNEFGPPVLSKLPYVNRLFRNTGFGREAQSLLIMVTPRVIINAEEEIKQTGVISQPDQ